MVAASPFSDPTTVKQGEAAAITPTQLGAVGGDRFTLVNNSGW